MKESNDEIIERLMKENDNLKHEIKSLESWHKHLKETENLHCKRINELENEIEQLEQEIPTRMAYEDLD